MPASGGTATPPTSGDGRLPVKITGPGQSVFGQVLTVTESPILHDYMVRGGDARKWKQYSLLGGGFTFDGDTALATLATGTTQYAYATLQTEAFVPYLPGTGVIVRHTAMFDASGVASSFVAAGPYHGEEGFGVGYNGTAFGIFHRTGRRFEVQALQITAAATGAETATVTLNGTAHNVSLTGGGTVNDDARELAEFVSGYTDSGGLVPYDPWALGDTVYYIRQTNGDAAGTFSYSSTGTSAGSFSEFQAGATGSQTWTPQASWNVDPLDGSGPSGMNLDVTKLNIYKWRYGWLGAYSPEFYVYAENGEPVLCHRFDWINAQAQPWTNDPRFPVTYAAASLGSTSNVTLSGASVSAAFHGESEKVGPRFEAVYQTKTNLGAAALIPVVSIMGATVNTDLSMIERRRLLVDQIAVLATGSKPLQVAIYLGDPANLTGYEFSQPNTLSPLWKDSAATAWTGTAVAVVRQRPVASGGTVEFDFSPPLEIQRGEVLTVLAQGLSSGTGSDIAVTINGTEDH